MAQEKRQRADRRKNIEKVAKAYLRKPRGTEREIAKLSGIDQRTVNRVKKELPQNVSKDDRILAIVEKDTQIVEMGQNEMLQRIREEWDRRAKNQEIKGKMEKLRKDYKAKKITRDDMMFEMDLLQAELSAQCLEITEINTVVKDSAARQIVFRGTLPKKPGETNSMTPDQSAIMFAALAALGR